MLDQALRARRPRRGDHGEGGAWAIEELGDPGEAAEARLELADETAGLRRRMAERLSERERRVLELRFGLDSGEPLTLKEVGRRLGCTREWARKIEVRAVAKLRDQPEGLGTDPRRGRRDARKSGVTGRTPTLRSSPDRIHDA